MIFLKLKGFQSFPIYFCIIILYQSILSNWRVAHNSVKVAISFSKKKSMIDFCIVVMAFRLGQFSLYTFYFSWEDHLEIDLVLDSFSLEYSSRGHLDVRFQKNSSIRHLDIESHMLPTHLDSFHLQPSLPKQQLPKAIVVLQVEVIKQRAPLV
jgi:hypothetical protein